MKKNLLFAGAIAIVLINTSCHKVDGRTDNTPALSPTQIDLNAGSWSPVLMTSATQFAVAAPIAVTTPDYIAQMNEIKDAQSRMTQDDQEKVKYWTAGAVFRWNEILRELVAKHNLPPYQNTDGTYPVPSANNPLAYPLFPFSNPPYASRAYAYVSAAQYDALVAAWYYKRFYNRPAPYKTDATMQALVPRTDLPSYPSTDAVVGATAAEMMKLLFPGDLDYINAKLDEECRIAILTGSAVRSDIDAGKALGVQVAQLFTTRARGDRAGAAVGTQTDWTALEQSCIARGETPWYSLELPKRPPMLPLFGKVKTFLYDSATMVAIRPGPPPPVKSSKMVDETAEVYNMISDPTREHVRIVQFWADGVGTTTPPGHWDDIACNDFIGKNYSEVRWARNLALLNMAMMDAAVSCWDAKNFYYNPRPAQLDPRIKTLTGVPNFPAYVSGHSTFSGAAATILGHIIPERAQAYTDMANEATMSRLYAGIHYRSDCDSGLRLGRSIGGFAIKRATTDGAE